MFECKLIRILLTQPATKSVLGFPDKLAILDREAWAARTSIDCNRIPVYWGSEC